MYGTLQIEVNTECIWVVYSNWMGTLLSSPCQLRLGVWLSHFRLSHYTWGARLRTELDINKQELYKGTVVTLG